MKKVAMILHIGHDVDLKKNNISESDDEYIESGDDVESNAQKNGTEGNVSHQQQKLSNFGFTKEQLLTKRKSKTAIRQSRSSHSSKKSKGSNVTFSSKDSIHVIPGTQQDDLNTVASDETSRNMNKRDEGKVVPPTYIRYRLGVQLDKLTISAILNDDNSGDKELNPAQRCREVFIELLSFVRSNIDPNALFISWKMMRISLQ